MATACILLLAACEKKESTEKGSEDYLTLKVNNFIMSYMTDAYLWNDRIPTNIDIRKETDPFAMLNKMIYEPLDRWTYLSDDAEALLKEYEEGVSTTYGYRITVYRFSNSDDLFGVVHFVYAGSPAEQAGVKRGDILLQINDKDITEDNYLDLYYSANISLRMGEITEDGIALSEKTVSMQAVEMQLDPVLEYKVIDKGAQKIGYLCYTDYMITSHAKLAAVFTEFEQAGVTDVVLDLRHNPGGAALTAGYLSSILAPRNAVETESLYLKELWNDEYMDYFEKQGEDLNQYFDKDALPVNMNLDRLYVLTTKNSASASEATIVGLKPYLNVIQIGEPTHGKYCGALLIQPWDSKGNVDKEIGNWLLSMVTYKYANKDGLTDFVDGLEPTYPVENDWTNYLPLGDENDPALATAISLITGNELPANNTRAAGISLPGTPLPASAQPDAARGGMLKLGHK